MDIISKIRKELKANAEEKYRKNNPNFFKEKINCYGVRTPIVRKISAKYFSEIKHKNKKDIFQLCGKLLASNYNEEATVAFDWTYRLRNQYKKEDFKIFEKWLKKYVNNWGKCDDFCNHSVGEFVQKYPQYIKNLRGWAKSKNQWLRRASAVTLILPARNEKFIKEAFEIVNILFRDKEDLVQKGYGWLLKEVSNKHQKEVFDYVMKNKKDMPRTALRYAIEKMPRELRIKAMK